MTMEEMFETNGYDVTTLNGEARYVTRDEKGRAVIGPVRRGGRGLMAMMRRKGMRMHPVVEQEAKESLREKWVRRVNDKQWHDAVRHVAIDIAMWSSMAALTAVSLKAAYWVVVL